MGEYLLSPSGRRHVWHAVLSVAKQDDWTQPETLDRLQRARSKDLLQTAYGSCPPGMVRLLSKLGPRAETAEFYRASHMALSRGDVLTRWLQHQQSIDRDAVLAISGLDTDPVTVAIASYVLRKQALDLNPNELSWIGRRLAKFDATGTLLLDISRSGNPVRVIRQAITTCPFPDAPWEARSLSPITSANDLASIAKQFGNCLQDHDLFYAACLDIQSGVGYYYTTVDKDPLLLRFSKFGSLGWYLDECRGEQNRRLHQEEITALSDCLACVSEVWVHRLSYSMR